MVAFLNETFKLYHKRSRPSAYVRVDRNRKIEMKLYREFISKHEDKYIGLRIYRALTVLIAPIEYWLFISLFLLLPSPSFFPSSSYLFILQKKITIIIMIAAAATDNI